MAVESLPTTMTPTANGSAQDPSNKIGDALAVDSHSQEPQQEDNDEQDTTALQQQEEPGTLPAKFQDTLHAEPNGGENQGAITAASNAVTEAADFSSALPTMNGAVKSSSRHDNAINNDPNAPSPSPQPGILTDTVDPSATNITNAGQDSPVEISTASTQPDGASIEEAELSQQQQQQAAAPPQQQDEIHRHDTTQENAASIPLPQDTAIQREPMRPKMLMGLLASTLGSAVVELDSSTELVANQEQLPSSNDTTMQQHHHQQQQPSLVVNEQDAETLDAVHAMATLSSVVPPTLERQSNQSLLGGGHFGTTTEGIAKQENQSEVLEVDSDVAAPEAAEALVGLLGEHALINSRRELYNATPPRHLPSPVNNYEENNSNQYACKKLKLNQEDDAVMTDHDDDATRGSADKSPQRQQSQPMEMPDSVWEARLQLDGLFQQEDWVLSADIDYVGDILEKFPILASENFEGLHDDEPSDAESRTFYAYPLVFLILAKADVETVEFAFDLYPDALAQPAFDYSSESREDWKHQGPLPTDYPLHVACYQDDYDDIIYFLAHKYRSALSIQNSLGHVPLHCMLGKRSLRRRPQQNASLAMIRTMVHLCPTSVTVRDRKNFASLEWAFYEYYDIFVINLLLEWRSPDPFVLHLTPHVLNGERARLLCDHILPRVLKLYCRPAIWTPEGLAYVLRCLQECSDTAAYLKHVDLHVPARFFLQLPQATEYGKLLPPSEQRYALRQVLGQNVSIPSMMLTITRREPDVDRRGGHPLLIPTPTDHDHELLKSISFGLASAPRHGSHRLKTLYLAEVQVTDPTILLDLLTKTELPPALTELYFSKVRVLDLRTPEVAAAYLSPQKSSKTVSTIESISLADCHMSTKAFLNFLYGLAAVHLPCLKHLLLWNLADFSDAVDDDDDDDDDENGDQDDANSAKMENCNVTEALVTLLEQNTLESCVIAANPFIVNSEPIFEVLKTNTSLKKMFIEGTLLAQEHEDSLINILTHHNTTLSDIRWTDRQDYEENYENNPRRYDLDYWTNLNRYGRAKARCEHTTTAEFVDLVMAVMDSSTEVPNPAEGKRTSPRVNPRLMHALLYGLLQESPNIWCGDNAKRHSKGRLLVNGSRNHRQEKRRGSESSSSSGSVGRKRSRDGEFIPLPPSPP